MNNKTISPMIEVPENLKEEEKRLKKEWYNLRVAEVTGNPVVSKQIIDARTNLAAFYSMVTEENKIGGIKK